MKFISILLITTALMSCAQQVDDSFTVPENYRSWKKPVDEVLTYVVPGHLGGARVIYANGKAFEVKKERTQDGRFSFTFPDGTVIIKEKYPSEDAITTDDPGLTIMVKNSSHKRAVNGWVYYMQPPGEDVRFIESKMCSGCHDAANEKHPYFDKNENEDFRDFIFVPF